MRFYRRAKTTMEYVVKAKTRFGRFLQLTSKEDRVQISPRISHRAFQQYTEDLKLQQSGGFRGKLIPEWIKFAETTILPHAFETFEAEKSNCHLVHDLYNSENPHKSMGFNIWIEGDELNLAGFNPERARDVCNAVKEYLDTHRTRLLSVLAKQWE